MLTYSDGAQYVWEMGRRFAGPNQTLEMRHLLAGTLALREAADQLPAKEKERFTLLQWQGIVYERDVLNRLLFDKDFNDPRLKIKPVEDQHSVIEGDSDNISVTEGLLNTFGYTKRKSLTNCTDSSFTMFSPNGMAISRGTGVNDEGIHNQFLTAWTDLLDQENHQNSRVENTSAPASSIDFFVFVLNNNRKMLELWAVQNDIDIDMLSNLLHRTSQALTLHSQMTQLIVPFSFGNDSESKGLRSKEKIAAIIENLADKRVITNPENRVWQDGVFNNERMFTHIDRLINEQFGENLTEAIGRRLVLQEGGRGEYNLPAADEKLVLTVKSGSRKQDILVNLNQFQLFLFETYVGFLVIEVSYSEDASIEEMINANYMLKSFKISDVKLRYGNSSREVQISDMCTTILKDLGETRCFEKSFAKHGKKNAAEETGTTSVQIPSHALVYSGIVLDRSFTRREAWVQELMKILYRLRRSFKESYKPSPAEFDAINNEQILQLFENSYWGVSLEGTANVVYLVDDATTNTFFSSPGSAQSKNTGSYQDLLRGTYLYLYILALHQRYGLVDIAVQASKLPDSSHLQGEGDSENPVNLLQDRISSFMLRCLFRQVGNNEHHNNLYEAIRKTLGVDVLLEELQEETTAISYLIELRENRFRLKQRREDQVRYAEEKKAREEAIQAERRNWEAERIDRERARDEQRAQWEEDRKERDKNRRMDETRRAEAKLALDKKRAEEQKKRQTLREQLEKSRENDQASVDRLQLFIVIVSTMFLILQTSSAIWSFYSLAQSGPRPGTAWFMGQATVLVVSILATLGGMLYLFFDWKKTRKTSLKEQSDLEAELQELTQKSSLEEEAFITESYKSIDA